MSKQSVFARDCQGNTSHTSAFQKLGLASSEVASIAEALEMRSGDIDHSISSLSFSYNSQLGDLGAIALAKHIPHSLHEIGLVSCGIGDTGGLALLDWIKKSTQLRMACIEQNSFSGELITQFRKLGQQVMVVV